MKLSEIGPNDTKGLKIFLIGLAAAACGFILAWLISAEWSLFVGKLLFFLGWILGAIGLGTHFWIMAKKSTENK